MNAATWIAIYLPLFVILLVIIPNQNSIRNLKIKKNRGEIIMTNELVKKYIGQNCMISNGSFGYNVIGNILEVNENWVEVETKKGVELINIEYVQNIKIVNK